jgi:hypothetical protein
VMEQSSQQGGTEEEGRDELTMTLSSSWSNWSEAALPT